MNEHNDEHSADDAPGVPHHTLGQGMPEAAFAAQSPRGNRKSVDARPENGQQCRQ